MSRFRLDALESGISTTVSLETLDAGLKGYNKGSLGGDLWHPNELKSLPTLARQQIATNLNKSFKELAWPHQSILSLNPCLGKPSGGCRTICKTPMLYRMCLRGLKGVPKWERMFTQAYDKAKRGSSCLLTALARGLRAEIAHWCKRVPVAVFNDMEKFFDSIDIELLLHEAIQLDFPADILVMALQQHLAPRVIQAQGYSSLPMEITNGILQGCLLSVCLTRLYLLRDIRALADSNPEANTTVFVDDTSCDTVQDTFCEGLDIVTPFTIDFAKRMRAKKLILSSKGSVLSNTPNRTRILQSILAKSNVLYNAADSARDLGVEYTAGTRRPKAIILTRLRKVKHRILKIQQISRISRMVGSSLLELPMQLLLGGTSLLVYRPTKLLT